MPDSEEPTGAAPQTPPPAARPRGFFRRHWIASTISILVAAPVLVFTVWAGIALSFSYSEGSRSGYVQKLSKKGWICKTWEGELTMTPVPGAAPTIFRFTVRDDSVAAAIDAVQGKLVTMTYEEHQGVPTSCFGETGHFATGVRTVNP